MRTHAIAGNSHRAEDVIKDLRDCEGTIVVDCEINAVVIAEVYLPDRYYKAHVGCRKSDFNKCKSYYISDELVADLRCAGADLSLRDWQLIISNRDFVFLEGVIHITAECAKDPLGKLKRRRK